MAGVPLCDPWPWGDPPPRGDPTAKGVPGLRRDPPQGLAAAMLLIERLIQSGGHRGEQPVGTGSPAEPRRAPGAEKRAGSAFPMGKG